MTKKADRDNTLCNGNRTQRRHQPKIDQAEETPRRSARLNSIVAEVNLRVKSRVGTKRSRVKDTYKCTEEQEVTDEFISEMEYTPKIKRVRVYTENKSAKKGGSVKKANVQGFQNDKCAGEGVEEYPIVGNDGSINNEKENEGGKASSEDARDTIGEMASKLIQKLVLKEQSDANERIEKDHGLSKDPNMIDKEACRESEATQPLSSTGKDYQPLNHTQKWNPKDSSHILAVKLALHLSAVPEIMICRENEQKRVFEFCKTCIEQGKAGSLYVCGCPGTGKSLLMDKLKSLSVKWAIEVGMPAPNSVVVNCTSLRDTSDIFWRILEQCQERIKHPDNTAPFQELKNMLSERKRSSTKKMVLLILDEMDYLITRDQSVLYDLFSLPTFPGSHCMLIGVANAIDLTDRFLPKLHSLNCKPVVVTFRAYSTDQILKILQQRLMVIGSSSNLIIGSTAA